MKGKNAWKLLDDTRDVNAFSWSPSSDAIVISFELTVKPDADRRLVWCELRKGQCESLPGTQNAVSPEISADGKYVFFSVMDPIKAGPPVASSRFELARRQVVDSPVPDRAFNVLESPDGRYVVYAQHGAKETSLWRLDKDKGTTFELVCSITRDDMESGATTGAQANLPAFSFSGDGLRIFISLEGKLASIDLQTGFIRYLPFVAPVSISTRQPLFPKNSIPVRQRVRTIHSADKSTNGVLIVSALGKLWRRNQSMNGWRRFSDRRDVEVYPSFSPNGSRLAYVSRSDDQLAKLIIAGVDGELQLQFDSRGYYGAPVWSLDGKFLYFWRSDAKISPRRDSVAELIKARVSDGEVTTLASTSISDIADYDRGSSPITVLKDETGIVFVQKLKWRPNQVIMRTDGEVISNLPIALSASTAFSTAFSPDGRSKAIQMGGGRIEIESVGRSGCARSNAIDAPVDVQQLRWTAQGLLTWIEGDQLAILDVNACTGVRREAVRLPVSRARPHPMVAYVDARIVTMNGFKVIDHGTLLVDQDRIVAVGPASAIQVPASAHVVNLAGKTIIPGLVDAHAHLEFWRHSAPWGVPLEIDTQSAENLAYGVTTLFDPQASENFEIFQRSAMIDAGFSIGPRILSTGDRVIGLGWNDAPDTVRDLSQARLQVARRVGPGAIYIKSYMQPTRDKRRMLLQAAEEAGIPVTTEGGSKLDAFLTHIVDGHASIEHEPVIDDVRDDVIQLFTRTGTFLTATLTASEDARNFFFSRDDDPLGEKYRAFAYQPANVQMHNAQFVPDNSVSAIRSARSVARLIRAGANVAIGSHGQPNGLGMHWNLWLLQLGGVTPHEALVVATIGGAKKLGLSNDIGSIEPGKLADFIVLEGNPLYDIRNTERIELVVKNGDLFDVSGKYSGLPQMAPLGKPTLAGETWKLGSTWRVSNVSSTIAD
ncbi:MAG TPA: amidohydrolase family protein [Sphingomicrobium sp.]|nr:amidohydrolase family protein [Sphingomicrobium sp.]